jgi:hypothetical protein
MRYIDGRDTELDALEIEVILTLVHVSSIS